MICVKFQFSNFQGLKTRLELIGMLNFKNGFRVNYNCIIIFPVPEHPVNDKKEVFARI